MTAPKLTEAQRAQMTRRLANEPAGRALSRKRVNDTLWCIAIVAMAQAITDAGRAVLRGES